MAEGRYVTFFRLLRQMTLGRLRTAGGRWGSGKTAKSAQVWGTTR